MSISYARLIGFVFSAEIQMSLNILANICKEVYLLDEQMVIGGFLVRES